MRADEFARHLRYGGTLWQSAREQGQWDEEELDGEQWQHPHKRSVALARARRYSYEHERRQEAF